MDAKSRVWSLGIVLILTFILLSAVQVSAEPSFDIDSSMVLMGRDVAVTIRCSDAIQIGGFNLLIEHQSEAMDFLYAQPLGVIEQWEYFSYRYTEKDTCGGDCPAGSIRLIGAANQPDDEDPGDVYLPEGEIIRLVFRVTKDYSYIGACCTVDWAWSACNDNSLISISGDSIFVAANIDAILAGHNCLNPPEGSPRYALLDFNGGLVCGMPPCARNDINLDGIVYDVSDAVLYANYFIFGPVALGYGIDPYYDNRVLESDINDDGIPLTVADLTYLLRIVAGDADPCPPSEP